MQDHSHELLNENDLEQIEAKGLTVADVEKQLKQFTKGFPYLNIISAATIGNGIHKLNDDELNQYLSIWEGVQKSCKDKIIKFIPASGAASRMFKALYEFINTDQDYTLDELPDKVKVFFQNIQKFAFYDALNDTCLKNDWRTVSRMMAQNDFKGILENLLETKGLSYGSLPKALLLFHKYDNGNRTAAEEHLAEGAYYAKNIKGEVNLHFTLSPEHIVPFDELINEKKGQIEDLFSVNYNITYSVQKPETDTIAVDMNNRPLRDAESHKLVFRPGGHGALIQNLNEIDADIIFIKNIDNVVPDRFKCDTIIYKKVLGGYLIYLRDAIFRIMDQLNKGKVTKELLESAVELLDKHFSVKVDINDLHPEEAAVILREKLNRPIRVCGMVKNDGEPGGGPYIIKEEDGSTSLQILESTQINKEDPKDLEIFENSSHFNPVDLVCCVKDSNGNKFDLNAFVDENTGFISHKSKDGVELKALELPGLWNGAMAGWNTSFIEVPASTFNPVKVVNDLLRDMHQ